MRLAVDVSLPPGWWQLPVGKQATERTVADVIGARISPAWAPDRDAIIGLAEAASAEATGAGVVIAAQIGVVDGAERFYASLVVALERFTGLDDPADLESFLRSADQSPQPGRGLRVDRVTVGRVGPGMRRSAIGPGADGTPVATIRYYAAVPDSGQTVVVDCTSGNVDDIDALLDLFGGIVDTLDVTVVDAGVRPGPSQ